MNRIELLAALKHASHALAAKDDIASFASFFFDGEWVRTYDDELSIAVRCDLPIRGGINGKLLLVWLGACSGDEVSVEAREGFTQFRCGRSSLRVSVLPYKDFQFDGRKNTSGEYLLAPFDFVDRLVRIVPFMNTSELWTGICGVGAVFDGNRADLYAANNLSAAAYAADLDENVMKPSMVQFMPNFLNAFTAISKNEAVSAFLFGDGWVEVTFEDESTLWSKTGKHPEIQATVTHILEDRAGHGQFLVIPEEFEEMVERASKVLKAMASKTNVGPPMGLTVSDNELEVSVGDAFDQNAADDTVAVSGEHPDVSVAVFPDPLIDCLVNSNQISISNESVRFTGRDFSGIVAVR